MKRTIKCLLVLLLLFMSVGCMYPQEARQQLDQLPVHIMQVQSSVDTYYKNNKILPYRYQEDERKFTSKYLVDFQKVSGANGIPPSAYEKGGHFLYVLVDVVNKPTVRLFDLRVANQIGKVESAIRAYKESKGQWPFGKKVDAKHYTVDYQKIGEEEPLIPSPFDAQENLTLILNDQGHVYLDYRMAAMKMIQESSHKPSEGTDLRLWLAQKSLYVPAFSLPMKWKNGEPVW